MLNARRARHGMHVDELGAADVRALDRRQRRAVEREPGEQHRRDLVVPDERVAERAEHDAERHLDGERHHQRDDDPLERAAVAARGSGRSRPRGAAGGAAIAPGPARSLPQRDGAVDHFLRAGDFLAELLVDGLARGDERVLVDVVDLHAGRFSLPSSVVSSLLRVS